MDAVPAIGGPVGAEAWHAPDDQMVSPSPRDQLIELYRSQRAPLTRLAIQLVGDMPSAEDVVQDAFVQLHRRIGIRISTDAVPAYLRTSVLNTARSALRRRYTRRRYIPPVERAHDNTAEAVIITDEHQEVDTALKRLPPRQREVLAPQYWSDLNDVQIADLLHVSRRTVRSTRSRALRAMEHMLTG